MAPNPTLATSPANSSGVGSAPDDSWESHSTPIPSSAKAAAAPTSTGLSRSMAAGRRPFRDPAQARRGPRVCLPRHHQPEHEVKRDPDHAGSAEDGEDSPDHQRRPREVICQPGADPAHPGFSHRAAGPLDLLFGHLHLLLTQ